MSDREKHFTVRRSRFYLQNLIFGAPAAYLHTRVPVLTLRHSSGTDISSHAAAFGICRIVAGYDLYLITGKVLQVGDDRRLL